MPTNKADTSAESPVWTPSDAVAGSETVAGGDAAATGTPQGGAVIKPRRSGAVTALLAIIALGATAGISFAAGRATIPATTASGGNVGPGGNPAGQVAPDASFVPGWQGQFGDRDVPGNRTGLNAVTGTVTAVGPDSITLKLTDGQTVTVSTTSTTTYHLRSVATSSDVGTGDTVVVTLAGGGLGLNSWFGHGSRTATDVTLTSE